MTILTVETLRSEAAIFSVAESRHPEPLLYGVTDGKAIGTYLEQKFKLYLRDRYEFIEGNSASGIDFPGLFVDIKVTSVKLIFWDEKRPIKSSILNSLNLSALIEEKAWVESKG